MADAYSDVFGHPGEAAQVQHFIDQLNYFEDLYSSSGAFGGAENFDVLAKRAIYGLLGIEAALTPFDL